MTNSRRALRIPSLSTEHIYRLRRLTMQSYKQYWHSLPAEQPPRTGTARHDCSEKRAKRETRSYNHQAIPFDSSRLPVIARKRIRGPLTPPPKPAPPGLSQLPQENTPLAETSFLAPIPASNFYGTPQTPSIRSGASSTPSSSGLLTPVTPPRLITIRIDSQTLDPSPTPYKSRRPDVTEVTAKDGIARDDTPTPRGLVLHGPIGVRALCPLGSQPRVPVLVPIILHHVSSSGGPLAALRRYDHALKPDSSLAGMSLFLNCPKKRVPFPSDTQLTKYRHVAEAWRRTMKSGGESSFCTGCEQPPPLS